MSDLIVIFMFAGSVLLLMMPIIVFALWSNHKKEMAKASAKASESEYHTMRVEFENMRHRLAALETIVTDKQFQLNEEISKLRAVDN